MTKEAIPKIKKHACVKSSFLTTNVIITLACCSLTLYQCSQSFAQFFAKETRVIISVLPAKKATFMGLTICPRFEEAFKLHVLNKLGISVVDYTGGRFFPSKNITNNSIDINDGFEIFKQVSFNLSEIMTVMNISTSDPINATITISFDKALDTKVAKWSEIFSNTYGRCYSMQISDDVTRKGVTNLVLVSKMGLHVWMHHPGQYINLDSKTKMYGLLGKMITLDVTYELLVNTLEKSHVGSSCNSTVDCTYEDCMMREISKLLLEEFGCLVPFLPALNGTKVCKFDYSTKSGLDQQKKVMNRFEFLISSGQRLFCPAPCSTMDVFVGLPFIKNYTNSDEAYVKLNMKTTTKVKKTVFDYTLVELWADVGGYTGLLLGTSVVHLLRSVDWVSSWMTKRNFFV